jgi:hypothetical protein
VLVLVFAGADYSCKNFVRLLITFTKLFSLEDILPKPTQLRFTVIIDVISYIKGVSLLCSYIYSPPVFDGLFDYFIYTFPYSYITKKTDGIAVLPTL